MKAAYKMGMKTKYVQAPAVKRSSKITRVALVVNKAAKIVPRMPNILLVEKLSRAARTRRLVTAQPVILNKMNTPAA